MLSKNKIYVYSFICCSLFIMSCTSNDDLLQTHSTDLTLKCEKSLLWNDSRIITDENGIGDFSDGDRIDLMVSSDSENKILESEFMSGEWIPSLNRADFSSDNINLYAIHPTLPSDNVGDKIISLPTDQSSQENLEIADVLYASGTANYSDSSVLLRFNHILHRICINLKGEVPDDLQIEVYSIKEGNLSFKEGKIKLPDNIISTWIKPFKKDRFTYIAIVLPQDVINNSSKEKFIKLTSGNKSVFYALDSNIKTLSRGMQTNINLTLKSAETGDVDTEFSNQTRWVYGVDAPDFPGKKNIKTYNVGKYDVEEGIWLRYAYEKMYPPMLNETQYLTWKEDCGWYDCNKSFEYEGDRNMCWAASASNLIHWWLEHNRKYIEAYDKQFGQEPVNMKRPEKYTKMTKENQHHSEVFNFFKSSCRDKGSWDTGGVNWYINGDRKNLSPDILNFNGFFSEVFTKDDKVAEEIKNMSKENFNKSMKDAFKNNKAIGFTSYDFAGKYTGVHALTIWGAEFDADGNVEYVYFCDNNSSDIEPNHASLLRYKVVYVESTIPEIKGLIANLRALDYNDGTIPTLLHPFSSLTLVDLRQDVWQKAFPMIK